VAFAEQLKTDSVEGLRNFLVSAPQAPDLVARALIPTRDCIQKHSARAASIARRAVADVRLPCMLYAAVGALFADAGAETELAISHLRRVHGVLHVLSYPCSGGESNLDPSAGIAVVTRGYWFSRQTLARLMAQCGGAVGMFAWNAEREGEQADARVTRGTAQFVDGHLHLWLATLDAVRSRGQAARIAGLASDLVDVRVVGQPQSEAGTNVLVSAIALARALQPSPVQVIVAQDFEHHPESTAARAPLNGLPQSVLLQGLGAKALAA